MAGKCPLSPAPVSRLPGKTHVFCKKLQAKVFPDFLSVRIHIFSAEGICLLSNKGCSFLPYCNAGSCMSFWTLYSLILLLKLKKGVGRCPGRKLWIAIIQEAAKNKLLLHCTVDSRYDIIFSAI